MKRKTGVNVFIKVLGIMALMGVTTALFGADDGSSNKVAGGLGSSGEEAQKVVTIVIQAFKWALAFMPVWSGWYFAGKMKEYLENKEEQGQYEPKAQKNFKIVGAVIIGIIAAYLIIGIIAKVFLGMGFGEAWGEIVVAPWVKLFGVGVASSSGAVAS
jgi:hypothetical protein